MSGSGRQRSENRFQRFQEEDYGQASKRSGIVVANVPSISIQNRIDSRDFKKPG
jgi:hypothetical protein